MRNVLFALLMACVPAQAGWEEISSPIIQVQKDCSVCSTNASGWNSATGGGAPIWTWTTINVATAYGLHPDTKWILASGILIITSGTSGQPEQCEMMVWYRAKGDTTPASVNGVYMNYIEQIVATTPSVGGLRQTAAVGIPVRNGEFEFMWGVRVVNNQQGTVYYPSYPTNCAFGGFHVPQMAVR